MGSQAVFPMPIPDSTRRQALALRAWEVVSSERHLQGVLEAISDVLHPAVQFSGLGIVSFHDGKHDLYAMHVVGMPHREGESMAEFIERLHSMPRLNLPARPFIAMDTDVICQAHSGIPY